MEKNRRSINYLYQIEDYLKNKNFCKRLIKFNIIKNNRIESIEKFYMYGSFKNLSDKKNIQEFINNLIII